MESSLFHYIKKIVLVVLLPLLLLLGGGGCDGGSKGTGLGISGVLAEKGSSRRISAAVISLASGEASDTTDEQGRFSLETNFPGGDLELIVEALGFRSPLVVPDVPATTRSLFLELEIDPETGVVTIVDRDSPDEESPKEPETPTSPLPPSGDTPKLADKPSPPLPPLNPTPTPIPAPSPTPIPLPLLDFTVLPIPSLTNRSLLSLKGTKEPGLGIKVNGNQVLAHSLERNWQVDVTLREGVQELAITAFHQAGMSAPKTLNIELDSTPPLAVINAVKRTNADSLLSILGSKEPNSAIFIEEERVVDFNSSSSWETLRLVPPGESTILNVQSVDLAGNAGPQQVLTIQESEVVYAFEGETGNLMRINPEAPNDDTETTLFGLSDVLDIAIDESNQKLYLLDIASSNIYRSNFDGTALENVFSVDENNLLVSTEQAIPRSAAIDSQNNTIYWIEFSPSQTTYSLKRRNLNTTTTELLVSSFEAKPNSLKVDSLNHKLYWIDSEGVRRSELDGTEFETLIPNPTFGQVIDFDIKGANNLICWSRLGSIHCSELDGSNARLLAHVDKLSNITPQLAVYGKGRKVFWGERITDDRGRIRGVDVDKGDSEEIIWLSKESLPRTLVINEQEGSIYWASGAFVGGRTNIIQRATLGGEEFETIIGLGLSQPSALTFDEINEQFFWFDKGSSPGLYTLAKGSSSSELLLKLSQAENAVGMALDKNAKQIYWTDSNSGKILRTPYDGGNTEEIVSGLNNRPLLIAWDSVESKVYWTEYNSGTIWRAEADGSSVEAFLVTDSGSPHGLAIDEETRKLYWSDRNAGTIERINLDKNERETLLSKLEFPNSISLDATSKKLYWISRSTEQEMFLYCTSIDLPVPEQLKSLGKNLNSDYPGVVGQLELSFSVY